MKAYIIIFIITKKHLFNLNDDFKSNFKREIVLIDNKYLFKFF